MKTKKPPARNSTALRNAPHVLKATKYAEDVAKGKIEACLWVKLACKRQLSDLKKQTKKTFRYRFDNEKAEKACRFIEKLPHTKGEWARGRELIVLQPWQCFIVCVLFGWVSKVTGYRRFRKSYIEVPRKNGKSLLAAAIALYMFCADGEFGAEVFSGATTEKQAWEVFRPAHLIVKRTPDMQEWYDITPHAKTLSIDANGSRFEPLIGKPGDGASPSCAIVDEFHEHKTSILVDAMDTGMGARNQPLLFEITTAGSDTAGPCYAQRTEMTEVLQGLIENDELFGIIWTIDEGDDWTSEKALRKANPNFGVSVNAEYLQIKRRDAINVARNQNSFKTKHLNVWVTARAAWMNMEAWKKCGDSKLTPDMLKGEACFGGLDLSSKIDITSAMKAFRRMQNGKPHFYFFGRHYLPEERIEDPTKRHYQGWEKQGWLTATDGAAIDIEQVEADLLADDKVYDFREIGFDPWGATDIANRLMKEGITCVEVQQRVTMLSEPMKMLEAYVLTGQIHHNNDPVLTWAISNITVKEDANDNIFPRKETSENKIDPATALIMAFSRALAADTPKLGWLL